MQIGVPSEIPFRCRHDSVVRTSFVGSPEKEVGINFLLGNCTTMWSLSKTMQLEPKGKETDTDEI
jgi:hypothetical protein